MADSQDIDSNQFPANGPWDRPGAGGTGQVFPGPTLATAVAAYGPLPVFSVLTTAARLAEALSTAHAAGIVHGDLTPSNVVLAADGPRLTGFGISRAVDRSRAPGADMLTGTPGYMSPEQVEGLDVGPASDIFSLGAILLYAATGQQMSYFAAHLDELPGELRPFIERCMAVDPARRPVATELLTALIAAYPAAVNNVAWGPAGIQPDDARAFSSWSGHAPPPVPFPAPAPYGAQAPFPANAPYGAPAPFPGPTPFGTQAPLGAQARTPQPYPLPTGTITAGAPKKPRWPETLISRLKADQKLRRHAWLMAIVAVAFAVVGAGTIYIIHPWPYPVLRPAGLTADKRGDSSISLDWSNPASGPLPDKYVILRDDAVAATVPGNVNHWADSGLAPATTFDFRVIAYRGSVRSQASHDFYAATQTPPVSDATLNSSMPITQTIQAGASSVQGDKDGDTWSDMWYFTSKCMIGPCDAHLVGSIDGAAFTADLTPTGGDDYGGQARINDYYYCGTNQNDHVGSTLDITITLEAAHAVGTRWQASKLTGDMTWTIDTNVNQNCGGGSVIMGLHS